MYHYCYCLPSFLHLPISIWIFMRSIASIWFRIVSTVCHFWASRLNLMRHWRRGKNYSFMASYKTWATGETRVSRNCFNCRLCFWYFYCANWENTINIPQYTYMHTVGTGICLYVWYLCSSFFYCYAVGNSKYFICICAHVRVCVCVCVGHNWRSQMISSKNDDVSS